ncbi:hypothetical protein CHUAL_012053 [Chamberlinius hualienensis]
MESSEDGFVQVSDIIAHVKLSIDSDQLPSVNVFDELWCMFDPNMGNVSIGIEKFREVMTLWASQLQDRLTTIKSDNSINNQLGIDNLNFIASTSSPYPSSPINNRPSSFGLIDHSMLINCTFGSLEGFGGDISQRDHLEMAAELKEMEYQNKRLKERISSLHFQLNTLEENNNLLTEERNELKKKLIMCRSSEEKCKELAESIALIKEAKFNTEIQHKNLQKFVDDLKKENSLLKGRIGSLKDDINTYWRDLEQEKTTRDLLIGDIHHLNIEVQQLEKEVEIKVKRITEEQKKCQETEYLVNYYKTMSEEFVTERSKLEIQLEQAVKDVEGYKKKYELTKVSLEEERNVMDISSNLSSVECGSAANTPLSLRQELEYLVNEDDHLPTPFCEKTNKHRFQLHENSEIHNNSYTDIPEHSLTHKKNMKTALEIIKKVKIETSSLLRMCQKINIRTNLNSFDEPDQLEVFNNEVKIFFSFFKFYFQNLNSNLELLSVVVEELKNIPDDISTCREIISIMICNGKCNNGSKIWGKSTNILPSDVQRHSSHDSHFSNQNDSSGDIYSRIIAELKNGFLMNDGSFETRFDELLESLVEMRTILFNRIQLQKKKRKLAKENVDKLIFNFKFGCLPSKNSEEHIRNLEMAIEDLSQNCESVGSITQEMKMCKILDKIVRNLNQSSYFGNRFITERRENSESAGIHWNMVNSVEDDEIWAPNITENSSSNNQREENVRRLNWNCCCIGGFILFGIFLFVLIGFFVFKLWSSSKKCSTAWYSSKVWNDVFQDIIYIQPARNVF